MWCLKFADCLVSAKGAARGACVNAVLLMHDASLFLGLVCCLFYFVLTKDVWGPFSVPVLSPFFLVQRGFLRHFSGSKNQDDVQPANMTMTLYNDPTLEPTSPVYCQKNVLHLHAFTVSIHYLYSHWVILYSYYIILCNHEWPLNSAVYPHHIPIMTLVIDVGWASPYSPCLVDLGGISCWNIPYTPYICECCV